jgi:hypothetical protein
MKAKKMILCSGLTVLLMTSSMANPGDPAKLISVNRCVMCHKKDSTGNQHAKWSAMGHAKAYETLGTDEAKAVAAKLGIDDPQQSGQCLKCHSTAYWFSETRQTEVVALENGVSCQSCHGPGADYRKKSVMESLEDSIANGMVYPAKEKSCTLCHNDTGPTWDPERYTLPSGEKVGFDVEQAYQKIKHENPAKK